MAEFTKTELEKILKDTHEHLAETKRMGPGYYRIRERYDYAVEADERYIEKLKKQIAVYDQAALNKNQQVVLDWLKEQVSIGSDLQYVLWEFTDNVYEEPATYSVTEQTKAWLELTQREQFQVLAAFADWGKDVLAE